MEQIEMSVWYCSFYSSVEIINMFQTLLIFVLLLSFCELQSIRPRVHPPHKRPGARIIGGDDAIPHAHPYQVGLSINDGVSFCGGILISENYVLTAAHCAVVISEVDVILGAQNLTKKETSQVRLKSSEIKIHEQYNAYLHRNDIALIKLNQSVTFTFAIQAAQLPKYSEAGRTYENSFAIATGWGLIEDKKAASTNDISEILQVLTVPVMNIGVCADYYNDDDHIYVSKSNLCTSGYKNKGTCKGDSGGPLVVEEVLVGVSSIGTTRCEECYPSIYTRVGAYLDWIEENSDIPIYVF